MTGKERADAAAALMAWFESQDINVPDAGGVLALAAGIIIGEAATTEAGLCDGLEALLETTGSYAAKTFRNKQTNRT